MQSGKLNSPAVSFKAKTVQPSGPGDLSDLIFLIYDRRCYCNRVQDWSFSIKRKGWHGTIVFMGKCTSKKSLNKLDLSLSVKTIESDTIMTTKMAAIIWM